MLRSLSSEVDAALARPFGITVVTVCKWRSRDAFEDRSHTADRLQAVMNHGQEIIAVYLRKTLLQPLDDLLAVMREFVCPEVSRSGLDRCLRQPAAHSKDPGRQRQRIHRPVVCQREEPKRQSTYW